MKTESKATIVREQMTGLLVLVTLIACQICVADELEARRFSIKTTPSFSRTDVPDLSVRWVLLDEGTNHFKILWSWNTNQAIAANLETNKAYTFTILERRETSFVLPASTNVTHEIVRIEFQGNAVFDRETCEAHRARMAWKAVPISYGFLVSIPGVVLPDPMEERSLFSHRARARHDGCTVLPVKTYGAFVCEHCETAYGRWLEQHPNVSQTNSPNGGQLK